MRESEKLRQQRAEELAAARALVKAAEDEKRESTDEEADQVEAHIAKAEEIEAAAKAAEDKERKRAETLAKLATAEAKPNHATPMSTPLVDPSRGARLPNVVGGEASGQFTHFGEFLFKVRDAALMPGGTDRRLLPSAAAPNMQTRIDSAGGFLIPEEYATRIIERMYSTGRLLSLVQGAGMRYSISGNTIKLPTIDESSRATGSRAGGVRGYWVEESGTLTDSYPRVGQLTLTLHKAGALGYITDEMLDDAPASGSFLERLLTQELIFTVEDSLVNGTGGNKPVGVIQADCAVSVTKETNQTAATIWGPNITKMWARFFAPCRPTSVWLVNQSCEPYLFSLALEGRYGSASTAVDAIPLYAPAASLLNQGQYATLMGRPVIPVEYTKAVGTLGDIILWDPASYVLVDKAGGPKMASSIHVQFLTEQTTFRVSYRVDGQPTWKSALTPYDAGSTLSCIVLLAARS